MTAQVKEIQNIRQLLNRVFYLMDIYFDAIESSLNEKNYAFSNREQDARVFNTLAHTLTRLTELDRITKPKIEENDDYELQRRLGERLNKIAEIAKPSAAKTVSKKPN